MQIIRNLPNIYANYTQNFSKKLERDELPIFLKITVTLRVGNSTKATYHGDTW